MSKRVTFRQSGAAIDAELTISLNGQKVGRIARRLDGSHWWWCRTDRVFVNTASRAGKTLDECKQEARAALTP